MLVHNGVTTSNCIVSWSSVSWGVSQLVPVEVHIEKIKLLLMEVVMVRAVGFLLYPLFCRKILNKFSRTSWLSRFVIKNAILLLFPPQKIVKLRL